MTKQTNKEAWDSENELGSLATNFWWQAKSSAIGNEKEFFKGWFRQNVGEIIAQAQQEAYERGYVIGKKESQFQEGEYFRNIVLPKELTEVRNQTIKEAVEKLEKAKDNEINHEDLSRLIHLDDAISIINKIKEEK